MQNFNQNLKNIHEELAQANANQPNINKRLAIDIDNLVKNGVPKFPERELAGEKASADGPPQWVLDAENKRLADVGKGKQAAADGPPQWVLDAENKKLADKREAGKINVQKQ